MRGLFRALAVSALILLPAGGLAAEVPAEVGVAGPAAGACGAGDPFASRTEAAVGPSAGGFSNCPRYHRCICHCQQEQVCCNNGGGQNCFEEMLFCFDDCVALLDPEEQCGVTQCSIDPFCNFP